VLLRAELDKSYETFLSSQRPKSTRDANPRANSYSVSPSTRTSLLPGTLPSTPNGIASAKPPPTGPRAHKKPRLAEPHNSPPRSSGVAPYSIAKSHSHSSARAPSANNDDRGKSRLAKMEGEEDTRKRPRSPSDRDMDRDRNRDKDKHRDGAKDKDRDRDRTRDREKDRDRERDRDRDRLPRRNGGHSSSGGNAGSSGSRKATGSTTGHAGSSSSSGDRTLAERMGL
jgi:hypothetical protein